MSGPELQQNDALEIVKGGIDPKEVDTLVDAIKTNSKEINDFFSTNANSLLSGIEKGLENKDDFSSEDIDNYLAVCVFIENIAGTKSDKKLEKIYTMLGYKEFKNIYNTVNDRNLLTLSDDQLKLYYTTYASNLVPENKSFFTLFNISEYDKEQKCLEVLKNAYIDHVVAKITQFNIIDKEGKKLGIKGEQITGVGTAHNYQDQWVMDGFRKTLELSETTAESVYNLAEYIDDLEQENKNEALGKLSLFLLKPINDMPNPNWNPKKFVFNVGGSSSSIDSPFIEKEQDLVDYRGGSAVSNNKANKGDKSNFVEYNYVLEKEMDDTKFNDNYREVNQQIDNAIKDRSYTYTLTISKKYENYVNKALYGHRINIQVTDAPNVFEIHKEKQVLSEPIIIDGVKVSGLKFNETPSTEQIEASLKTTPEFQLLLNAPEKYVINSCKVKGSASHVPTDHKAMYASYNNIASEQLLSSDGSDTNKALAKDRAYAYINYIDNQGFAKGSEFKGFDLSYSVNGKQYENDLDNPEYPANQYAEITLTYQEKKLDKDTQKLDPPHIQGEPPEFVSFGYEIPPYIDNK